MKTIIQIQQIFSGGQTGVDRAALDFALIHGIPCGGFCPKGRLAEDGPITAHYPLEETEDTSYESRTEMNIRHSDGTLIFYLYAITGGTLYTYQFATTKGKPLFLMDLTGSTPVSEFQSWIKSHHISILNVAGPRESQEPGIYSISMKTLASLLRKRLPLTG